MQVVYIHNSALIYIMQNIEFHIQLPNEIHSLYFSPISVKVEANLMEWEWPSLNYWKLSFFFLLCVITKSILFVYYLDNAHFKLITLSHVLFKATEQSKENVCFKEIRKWRHLCDLNLMCYTRLSQTALKLSEIFRDKLL